MKNIAFMPLREGSKSIPLKNIKVLAGKPLCYWSLFALQNSVVDKIYIATDSRQIKDTISSFNFSKIELYDRSARNAQDNSTTEEVMLEFLDNMKIKPDINFMLVQATSPFTKTNHFDQALAQYLESDCDSLLSATLTKRFFWKKDGIALNYDYKNRPLRQYFEGYYMENGAFYINSVANILKYKNRLCGKISIYEMPEYTSFEIDEEIDWIIAEKLLTVYN